MSRSVIRIELSGFLRCRNSSYQISLHIRRAEFSLKCVSARPGNKAQASLICYSKCDEPSDASLVWRGFGRDADRGPGALALQ